MLEELKRLHRDVQDATEKLASYIQKTDFSNEILDVESITYLLKAFGVNCWIDSTCTKLLEEMLGKDLWDLGFSKYQVVYYTELCDIVDGSSLAYDRDQCEHLLAWAETDDIIEAKRKASNVLMQHAIKTKSSGFELDW